MAESPAAPPAGGRLARSGCICYNDRVQSAAPASRRTPPRKGSDQNTMGLFSNYNKPGPGVAPDAPRKRGLSRLIEILGRDMGSFFKAGMLAFASCIPFVAGAVLAVLSHGLLVMIIAGIVGGALAGPQLTALADTILRSLRDEPGFWWQTYRRAWKRNAKASLVPGAIFGLLFGSEIFLFFHLDTMQAGSAIIVMMLVGTALVLGFFTYVWPQIALLELPLGSLLKNAVFLFLAYLPASLGATVVQFVYWAAVIVLFPLSAPVFLFTNFWVPMVPSLLIVYNGLDKSFGIEDAIRKIRDAQLSPDGDESGDA